MNDGPLRQPHPRGRRVTNRLLLEPIHSGLHADMWRLHQDPGVAEWYAGAWTEEQAKAKADAMGEAWSRDGVSKWMAYSRDTGELIGRGGLSRTTLDGRDCLELGWAVLQDFWGRGYATEMGRAGLDFACTALDAHEVLAYTERHNLRSRAVMERLGMTYAKEIVLTGLVEGNGEVSERAPFAVYRISNPGRKKAPVWVS